MGGATENNAAMRWFLGRASGGDIVVLRASGSDGYNDYFYSELGVNINSVRTFVFNDRQGSFDEQVLSAISNAEGIWIAGGDQSKYVLFWRNTPLDSLINYKIKHQNMVIGGTSAGMAILGEYYFSAANGTIQSQEALNNPSSEKAGIDSARFIQAPYLSSVITDTHFDNPDRKGRLITFMANIIANFQTLPYAIACEEYTSVCIDDQGIATIFGDFPREDDYAYFISYNCLKQDPGPEVFSANQPLSWDRNQQALSVYKIPGSNTGRNTFNLNSWASGQGGNWLYWSVKEGQLFETEGAPKRCELVTGSVEDIPQPYQLTRENGEVLIKPASGIEAIEVYTISGRLVKSFHNLSTATTISLSFQSFTHILVIRSVLNGQVDVRKIVIK
jgi:cyanophycinase-like exopeptidase